jgi:hypothetical protein
MKLPCSHIDVNDTGATKMVDNRNLTCPSTTTPPRIKMESRNILLVGRITAGIEVSQEVEELAVDVPADSNGCRQTQRGIFLREGVPRVEAEL